MRFSTGCIVLIAATHPHRVDDDRGGGGALDTITSWDLFLLRRHGGVSRARRHRTEPRYPGGVCESHVRLLSSRHSRYIPWTGRITAAAFVPLLCTRIWNNERSWDLKPTELSAPPALARRNHLTLKGGGTLLRGELVPEEIARSWRTAMHWICHCVLCHSMYSSPSIGSSILGIAKCGWANYRIAS